MILTDVCQGGGKREDLEALTGMSKNVGSDLSGARSHWLIDRSRSGRGRKGIKDNFDTSTVRRVWEDQPQGWQ